MPSPRRILVPFDFHGPSKRACDYALELGAALGAALTLVHVVERFDTSLTAVEHAAILTETEAQLERTARLLRPHVRAVEAVVVEGTPWEEIEATAKKCRADLIVMGTHGRRGIARALLGSVAARVIRTSGLPVTTLPEHVAISRNDAGYRLAAALEPLHLERPNVVALSRGALTVATALAGSTKGTIDLWGVEPVVTKDGIVLGAMGEDEAVAFEGAADGVSDESRQEAVAAARTRLRAELAGMKGARTIGSCWRRDVVLVADGLFSTAYAEVAIEALRKLGPARIVIASPVIARDVAAQLEGKVDAVVALERAIIADSCRYRDDILPSDVVAYELLLSLRPPAGA